MRGVSVIPLAITLPSGCVARVVAYAWDGGIQCILARADATGHIYAALPRSIDYIQIGRALDALEATAKTDLSAELRRVRSDLAAQLRTAEGPQAFKTLPRREHVEAEVLLMLTRAQEAGQRALQAEAARAKGYAASSYTPKAAMKWLRESAFWITDVLADDLLGAAQKILVKGLRTGAPASTMMRELFEEFVPYLGGDVGEQVVTAHRLETIVRTNTTTAYNHGRLTAALDPDIAAFVDGVRYSAILDSRTTPVCQFLHEKVFRLPDQEEDLVTLTPPRHFNCRSVLVPIVVGEEVDPSEYMTEQDIWRAKRLSAEGFTQRGPFARYTYEQRDAPHLDGVPGAPLLAARVALLKAQLALYSWDEAQHPRVPKGSGDRSGEFAPSGGRLDQDMFKTDDEQTTEAVREGTAKRLAALWDVSLEDLTELSREDGFKFESTISLSEMKEGVAFHYLRKWSGSSGGPIAEHAARAVLNDLGIKSSSVDTTKYIEDRPALDRAISSFGRAMYQNTQGWLANRGVISVNLLRAGGPGQDRLFTSWSTHLGGVRHESGRTVIKERIPAKYIWSVPSTGFGTLAESEVVVLGHRK